MKFRHDTTSEALIQILERRITKLAAEIFRLRHDEENIPRYIELASLMNAAVARLEILKLTEKLLA